MTRFKKFKRKKKKSFFSQILILGILIFILALLVVINFRINQKKKELGEEVKFLEDKFEKLYQEREVLQLKISQGRTEDYLERVAREEFNLKKEGEEVVVFPILEKPQEEKELKTPSFWQKILEGLTP